MIIGIKPSDIRFKNALSITKVLPDILQDGSDLFSAFVKSVAITCLL